jgi:hypothetical protein
MICPTVAGFITFIRKVMGINTTVLPDSAPVISMAFAVSLEIVNRAIQCVSPLMYELAVYNLAGDNLVNYAQDTPPSTYFADLRASFNTLGFVSGVISASNDVTTGQSLVVQEAAKNFTLANLQQLKTPWGRAYLGIAQDYGPNVWGLS